MYDMSLWFYVKFNIKRGIMKFLTKNIHPTILSAFGFLVIATFLSGANAQADGHHTEKKASSNVCKNSYSLISYELRPRSVPKFIKALKGDLAIDNEQKQALKRITQYVPKNVLPMRKKIKSYEQALISGFVEDGKTPEALSEQLDKLTQMKRELAVEEIKVFNQLKKILTPKQYQTAIQNAGWMQ